MSPNAASQPLYPSGLALRTFCLNLPLSLSCPIVMYLINRVHVPENKRWPPSSHLFSWDFWLIHRNPSSWQTLSGALITSILGIIIGCRPVVLVYPPGFPEWLFSLQSTHCMVIDRCLSMWNNSSTCLSGNSSPLSFSKLIVEGRNNECVSMMRLSFVLFQCASRSCPSYHGISLTCGI